MFLLDTNICIFAINKKSENVIKKIHEKSVNGIYISSITIAELEYGVQNSTQIDKNKLALLKFISIFNVIDFSDHDATVYGNMKTLLRKKGKLFGPLDMLIAAHALSRELILVTNNTTEFEKVEGLRLEDWK